MSKGVVIALAVLTILPVIGALGWYALTEFGSPAGEAAAESGDTEVAPRDRIIARSGAEGFKMAHYDACNAVEDHYRKPSDSEEPADFTLRQLIGLKKTTTDEQVRERCVVFAKVVARMRKLAHHDRYVFACKGAAFKVGKEGKYRLLPDRKGVLEVREGVKRLIPVRRNSQTLLGNWQIYNLGDGCMVIGLSESGAVRFSYDADTPS